MTAGEVAKVMCGAIHAASIKLHQAEACQDPSAREGFIRELAAACDRYWHCLISLVMLGRADVAEDAAFMNLETGVPEPTKAAKHQEAQAAALVPTLGLSEQQQELIACGTQLNYDSLAGIRREQLAVNTALAATEPRQEATGSNTDSSSTGGGSSSGASSSEDGSQLAERLEKQQQLTERLSLLLHKEYHLRIPFKVLVPRHPELHTDGTPCRCVLPIRHAANVPRSVGHAEMAGAVAVPPTNFGVRAAEEVWCVAVLSDAVRPGGCSL